MPGLEDLVSKYAAEGLHVLAFPTDQGWFEADDSNTLRIKFKQVYNFGQYPSAVLFDKADLLGTNALPIYRWLTTSMPNPWGAERIVFKVYVVITIALFVAIDVAAASASASAPLPAIASVVQVAPWAPFACMCSMPVALDLLLY
mgnify:CR=1 FL=1